MEDYQISKNIFIQTPLIESKPLSKLVKRSVFLKLENLQPSGSFKLRGLSRLCQMAVEEGYKKIISSSGGNSGLAVKYIANKLNLSATIIVPEVTSQNIVDALAEDGTEVIKYGSVWNIADEKAQELAKTLGIFYVTPFDHPMVWDGHSTMIEELHSQLAVCPSVIVCSVGGGGLLCGILSGLAKVGWQDVPVVAMETKGAESFNVSVKAGHIVRLPEITSIAKCLGSVVVCQQLMDYLPTCPIISEVVEDREAVLACLKFADDHRMLVQPACGATLAALYSGILSNLIQNKEITGDGPVVVIVCGGCDVTLNKCEEWKQIIK
ncbi:serine dehydratase-like isoform X2 [Tachypleus tridentatus]|uniref:serine dehydratase-like isoform X2 n=1 Tax=Tachypleus tridentatus TaxID=6853 RepID=UPI003FD67580